jgi:small GTP-binding protein
MRTERVKLKVCLVGERGVGKTSLVRRYVLDAFSDKYVQTLGTKVSKKEIDLFVPAEDLRVHALIQVWDIMGHLGFRELLRAAYFHGCQGILAVCDVTQDATLGDLDLWLEGSADITGEVPVHLLVNKVDLEPAIDEGDLRSFAGGHRDMPYLYTSAKRGDNVTRAFEDLARRITEPMLLERGFRVKGLLANR